MCVLNSLTVPADMWHGVARKWHNYDIVPMWGAVGVLLRPGGGEKGVGLTSFLVLIMALDYSCCGCRKCL